jgi:hypothetical protein
MPNFARKTGQECSMCHTAIPKLNRYGYEYRSAGYRDASEIGIQDEAANLGHLFSARIQAQALYNRHDDVNDAKDSDSNNLNFFEATLYPLTGSWGKRYGSIVELSMAPDDVFEIENAFVRAVWGGISGWFQARIGVMHPWEGAGASDRPLGISRPLIQRSVAIGSPFFLWNVDETAAEVGYHSAKSGTSVSARVSNGILWKEDGSGVAEPAQGGALTKPQNEPGADSKNFQAFFNQYVKGESAVSLYYYYGTVPFPDPNYALTTATTRDNFQRLAAYANAWVVPDKIDLLAGVGYGHDSLKDNSVASSDSKYVGTRVGDSVGFFGEVDYHRSEQLAFGGRFDQFDPSDKVDHNSATSGAVFANYALYNGLQFVGEYQHREAEQSAGGKNKDDVATLRMIFIW